ncbi:DUF2079 domain-containing protein [Ferroplasma sp.]|uniref:DUF2079 domain-containing protein n=1 Tax=Ferroplasma sp. TaxID=2591003 RepID=UPI00307F2257
MGTAKLLFFKSLFKDGDKINYRNLIILISAIFAVSFSFYSIMKAYTINAYAWDLGLYSQAFYSTLHGKLFYTNLLGESYLAEHFSPFMFLLLPIFYIFPSPYTLLAIQSVFISLAAIPLYYLSSIIFSRINSESSFMKKNSDKYSFLIAVAFLLSPLTESPVYFDFHLMIFLPFFYFMSIYFYLKKKLFWNLIFLVFIVSLHSSFAFIVAMTLITEFLISRYYLKEDNTTVKNTGYIALAGIVIFTIYYVIAGYIKADIADSHNVILFVSGASGTASKSVYGLLNILLYHPYAFFGYVGTNYQIKLLFLVLAFMAVDFAFYRFPAGLLPAVPYLIYSMTSSYLPYYFIGYQYSMMLIPFVFVAGVFGIAKMIYIKGIDLKKIRKANRNVKNTMIAIMAFAIAAFIVVSPISPISMEPAGIHNIINDSSGYTGARNKMLYSLEQNISMDSTLVTGNNIFPLFYKDMNATAFPYGNISSGQHYKYLIADLNDSQTYIKDGYNISLAGLASDYMNSGSYGILAEGYGVIALEEHYTGKPIIYKPSSNNYGNNQFIEKNNNLIGPIPDNHISSLQIDEKSGLNVYCGNATYLLPGNYSIYLHFNNTNKLNDDNINITAYANYGNLTIEHITSRSYMLNGNTLIFNLNASKLYTGVTYAFTGVNNIAEINYLTIEQNTY